MTLNSFGAPRADAEMWDGRTSRAPEVHLFPLKSFCGVKGSIVLDRMHEAQRRSNIREVWSGGRTLPEDFTDFIYFACDHKSDPLVRHEAVLLLRRYLWHGNKGRDRAPGAVNKSELQVVALTCANLARKHWQHRGISQQQLHWLCDNAFTHQDVRSTEAEVLNMLGCNVYWEGVLLPEWVEVLLHFSRHLMAESTDVRAARGVATDLLDLLLVQDEIMASYWPSELAAAVLHASITVCTKSFRRRSITLYVAHLARTEESSMVKLSEGILAAIMGSRCTELLLEGSGITPEDTDLDLVPRSRSRSNSQTESRQKRRRLSGLLC